MKGKFICNGCKKEFTIKERGAFSYTHGSFCKDCSDKISYEMDKEEKEFKKQKKRKFEEKVRKIVNKVLEEKEGK